MNEAARKQIGRYLPLAVTLAITIFFVFWIRDFMREVIVQPLLLVTWYTTLIFRSFPDSFYWILFILVVTFIGIRSLLRDRQIEKRGGTGSLATTGPISSWARLIQHSGDGGYSQWQLAQSLCKLTWDLLRDERNRSMRRIEQDLQAKTLDLSPEIQAYFEAGLLPYQPTSKLKRRLGLEEADTALSLDPTEVVQFIEAKLNPITGDRVIENTLSGDAA